MKYFCILFLPLLSISPLFAQSFAELVDALPPEILPLFDDGIKNEMVYDTKSQTVLDLMMQPMEVERYEQGLTATWTQGESLSLIRLPKRGGAMLAVLLTIRSPYPQSALLFFDKEGKRIEDPLLFLPLTHTPYLAKAATEYEQQLFLQIPLELLYHPKEDIFTAKLYPEAAPTSDEIREQMEQLLQRKEVTFSWHRGSFRVK